MGSLERRTRERADTRERILDAAREMFVEHGYEATTMRAIADRIEYTPTAIYHHFPSKEALLTELCAQDFRALASAFRKIGRIEDPINRLVRLGEAYVAFALDHPKQYQLLFMTPHPQVAKGVRVDDPSEHAYGALRETCREVVASGRLRPEFGDPEEVAQIAWSSLHGLMALHIVKRDDGDIAWREPRRTASTMCRTLVRGMLRDV